VQSAWADEVADLGGVTVTKTASEFSAYKDKIIENGTINMSGARSARTRESRSTAIWRSPGAARMT